MRDPARASIIDPRTQGPFLMAPMRDLRMPDALEAYPPQVVNWIAASAGAFADITRRCRSPHEKELSGGCAPLQLHRSPRRRR